MSERILLHPLPAPLRFLQPFPVLPQILLLLQLLRSFLLRQSFRVLPCLPLDPLPLLALFPPKVPVTPVQEFPVRAQPEG